MGVPNGTAKTNGHASPRAAEYNLPSHFIGGNRLDVALPSAVRDFVAQHEGHSVITSVGFLPFFALYIYIYLSYSASKILSNAASFQRPANIFSMHF